MAKNKLKISDLKPDDNNFNKGTEFGDSLMEKSLRNYGAGRSILLDKNNRIIAGNKTAQKAGEIGIENVQVIESDGTTLIAVKRTDIDLDSSEGRELALADNAVSKVNLEWDEDNLIKEFEYDELKEWGIHIDDSEEIENDKSEKTFDDIFEVVCTFESEKEQEQAFNELKKMGYQCRVLTL